MFDNHHKIWMEFVSQAQKHLEGPDPMQEDAMIVRMDVYLQSLEKRIAEMTYAEDLRQSKEMSEEQSAQVVKDQIDNEMLVVKGNV